LSELLHAQDDLIATKLQLNSRMDTELNELRIENQQLQQTVDKLNDSLSLRLDHLEGE
jgi:hypothetical protein